MVNRTQPSFLGSTAASPSASTGLTSLWRYPDDAESFGDGITIYPDHVVGRVGAAAVLAQIIRRRRTGQGGTVSMA